MTERTADPLQARWDRLCAELAVAPQRTHELWQLLVERYEERGRHYHTLEHISEVLAAVDRLRAADEPTDDPAAIELAAWFHDVVYDPAAGDNERRSADLARETLAAGGVGADRLDHVGELIMATASHLAQDQDAAVLVDADLGILGASPGRYDRYTADVRAEYAHVDAAAWVAGRTAVLRGLLDRPTLYHTATLRAERGARARRNMGRELKHLTDP